MAWGKPQCATKPISQLTLWLLVSLEVIRLQKLYFMNSCYKWHQQLYTKFYTVIQLRNLHLDDSILDTTSSEINGMIKTSVFLYYYYYCYYYYYYYYYYYSYSVDNRPTMRRQRSFPVMKVHLRIGAFIKVLENSKGDRNVLRLNLLNKRCLSVMNLNTWLRLLTKALIPAK